MTRNRWVAVGAATAAAVAAAVVIPLALTGGSSGPKRSDQLSHDDFEALWDASHLGDSKQAVLARWPVDPYQHYTDNLKDDCYEWSDEPSYLYNLCFKDGVLRLKTLF